MSRSDIVPAIPKDKQVPVLETDVMAMIKQYFISRDVQKSLHRRLKAGAAKYGTAWSEVNLVLDLEEEILDAMNYVAMAAVRLIETQEAPLPPERVDAFIRLEMMAFKLETVLREVRKLPQMEGPSSKDWLPQHGIDPAEAQERFQDVVNAN